MPDPPSEPSKWNRARSLASALHALLRTCIEDEVTKPWSEATATTLVELHRLKRKLRRTLELTRPDRLYSPIDSMIETVAEHVLLCASREHPDQRLKDLVRGMASCRGKKMVRAQLRKRTQHLTVDVIRNGLLAWETPLEADDDFGHAMDERVVELPLAFEVARFRSPGRVLDAGSSLNHAFLRALIDPPVPELVHFTQSGAREEARFAGTQVSYVFGDLRSMPFRDGYFDRIVCISTLEHVGMNNARYGAPVERQPESSAAAVCELMRVLAAGGTLLITVPYGQPASRDWFRTFGPGDIRRLLETACPSDAAVRYYRFGGSWYSTDGSLDTIPPDLADDEDDAVRAIAAIRLRK